MQLYSVVQILFENAYVDLQRHLPVLSVKDVLHAVHAPVNAVHAEQFYAHAVHTLFPGLYYPVGHVVGFTQTPLTKAEVLLQPHLPGEGVFEVNDVLHAVQ